MTCSLDKKEPYALAWYSVENDELIGEEQIQLSQDTVREWFDLSENDPAIYCYYITAIQRQHLMKMTDVDIDLNKYVYQLEGRA